MLVSYALSFLEQPYRPPRPPPPKGEESPSMISQITYYYLFEWIDSKALTVCYVNDSANLITAFTLLCLNTLYLVKITTVPLNSWLGETSFWFIS